MSNYISSNANRFYVAIESSYGRPAPVTSLNRFPAVQLQAQQILEALKRQDKTGTRTFLGSSSSARRQTAFQVRTYLTAWNGNGQPGYGPLFEAAFGGTPVVSSGLVVGTCSSNGQMTTTAPHGLSVGSAVAFGNEIRFVTTVVNEQTIITNAPFSTIPAASSPLAPSISFPLGTLLPSITLYDYWDPATTVSRLLPGAAVDSLRIAVNGDYHEFSFTGPAANLLDSVSFAAGESGLQSFPAEPALSAFNYGIVPGHLGEAWLGGANQFFTLTAAMVAVNNNIELRNKEYGSSYPLAVAPGPRRVGFQFTLFAQDSSQTNALYASAKERTPVPAMLQLGQQQAELMGIYMQNVVPKSRTSMTPIHGYSGSSRTVSPKVPLMMKSFSLSPKQTCYSTVVWHESTVFPGVHFAVRRSSLAQRIELTRKMRELTLKNEFLRAGDTADQLQASLSDLLARRTYVQWGLAEIRGLIIDGLQADVESVLDKGPENLIEEIITRISDETGLNEQERKNS